MKFKENLKNLNSKELENSKIHRKHRIVTLNLNV